MYCYEVIVKTDYSGKHFRRGFEQHPCDVCGTVYVLGKSARDVAEQLGNTEVVAMKRYGFGFRVEPKSVKRVTRKKRGKK